MTPRWSSRARATTCFLTTGIGVVPDGVNLSGHLAQPGDAVLVSTYWAFAGVAILSQREGLAFAADVVSDSAALHTLAAQLIAAYQVLFS